MNFELVLAVTKQIAVFMQVWSNNEVYMQF